MAIGDVQDQRSIVERGGGIEIGDVAEALGGVVRTVLQQVERFSLAIRGEELQRVIDGLQEQAGIIGEDGRNDVNQLRHVGDLHNIGVIDEGIQESRNDQSIFQVVMLFQDIAATLTVTASAI